MATRSEVEQFLNQFKVKLEIWGIFFLDNREKNKETMALLNFRRKDVDGHEIYIKISLGRPGSNSICISFHIAEHPMQYPFKEVKND